MWDLTPEKSKKLRALLGLWVSLCDDSVFMKTSTIPNSFNPL